MKVFSRLIHLALGMYQKNSLPSHTKDLKRGLQIQGEQNQFRILDIRQSLLSHTNLRFERVDMIVDNGNNYKNFLYIVVPSDQMIFGGVLSGWIRNRS